MKCDICNCKEATNFGRWLMWCDSCKKEGIKKDRQLVIENEITPDLESGDFTYTLNQGLSDYLL